MAKGRRRRPPVFRGGAVSSILGGARLQYNKAFNKVDLPVVIQQKETECDNFIRQEPNEHKPKSYKPQAYRIYYLPTLDLPHKATVGMRCGFNCSKVSTRLASDALKSCRIRGCVVPPKGSGGSAGGGGGGGGARV